MKTTKRMTREAASINLDRLAREAWVESMLMRGNTVERSHWLDRMPEMSKVQERFSRRRSWSRTRTRMSSTAPPSKRLRREPSSTPVRVAPVPPPEYASASEVLTPPMEDNDALWEINDFLHLSGPQSTGSWSQEKRPDARRVLLYEDGESDHIIPKLKKKFGMSTGSNSVSSSSHRVPTQNELQELRSPKEANDEVVELFVSPPGAVFSTSPLGHRGSCSVILEPGPPGNVTRNYVIASLCMYPSFFSSYWIHNLFPESPGTE